MSKWLIELSDGETEVVTSEQLLKMEATCDEFDGFYPWVVLKEIEE